MATPLVCRQLTGAQVTEHIVAHQRGDLAWVQPRPLASIQETHGALATLSVQHRRQRSEHGQRHREQLHLPRHMKAPTYRFEILAEDAVLLHFGEKMDAAINSRVHAATARLARALPSLECVPAYASMLLRFEPLTWLDAGNIDPHQRLRSAVDAALANHVSDTTVGREHVIPVCYGGRFGTDIEAVANYCGLTTQSVATQHAAASYRVAMIGFAPGFPYLLGLRPKLFMPRRNDPRQRVPVGSVAIGGEQTGIYPGELPGGWHVIGRTPLRLFDVHAAQPSWLMPGDRLRFQPVDEASFEQRRAEQTP